jgi:CheY-like chemotaxis protein
MAAGQLISIVDDDPSMLEALVGLVRSLGYDARGFVSAEDFLASIDLGQFACAITDIGCSSSFGDRSGQIRLRLGQAREQFRPWRVERLFGKCALLRVLDRPAELTRPR